MRLRLRDIATGIVSTLVLAACGGGGDAPADGDRPEGSLGCVSTGKVVRIQLFGDSTQYGFDGATQARATTTPDSALQAALDGLFGMGAVTVENRAVFGTASTALIDGTDGLNKPWPQSLDADIAVVNFGINDARTDVGLDAYEANLRTFATTPGATMFLETPNPVANGADTVDVYAAAMRTVASQTGTALIDVNAYVYGLPDWPAMVPDGTHPDAALYAAIGTDVLAPALTATVKALRCR